MKTIKTNLMVVLLSCLGTAPVFAAPYVSVFSGMGFPGDREFVNGVNMKLDNDPLLNGACGYKFDHLRVEAAIGYEKHNFTNGTPNGKADISFHTLMANGYYNFDDRFGMAPYLMAGSGILSTDVHDATGTKYDTQHNFAWQVGTGIGIKAASHVTFDFGYRYLKPSTGKGVANGLDVNWEGHSILAGIRYEF